MMHPNPNPSAFPLNTQNAQQPGAFDPEPGMSLRDWFAGKALAGLLANGSADNCPLFGNGFAFARDAYLVADAMLVARTQADAS